MRKLLMYNEWMNDGTVIGEKVGVRILLISHDGSNNKETTINNKQMKFSLSLSL